jgi:nucleoside-diphosphate-sugar epimerase
MAANFDGTSNVLEEAIRAGTQRFVQVSSLAVHPFTGHVDADESTPATNRINGYCASKIAAEQLVMRAQQKELIQTTIVRPGAIIHGPGDTTTFVHLAPYLENGKMVLVNGGRQFTCYAYSENLADGLLLAGARPEAVGEVITLNDDIKITIRQLMEAICQALGVPPQFSSVSRPVARAGAWVLDRLWKLFLRPNPPPVHRYRVAIVARDFHFTARKAKRLLGYQPSVSLEEGLRRTVEWYREL